MREPAHKSVGLLGVECIHFLYESLDDSLASRCVDSRMTGE